MLLFPTSYLCPHATSAGGVGNQAVRQRGGSQEGGGAGLEVEAGMGMGMGMCLPVPLCPSPAPLPHSYCPTLTQEAFCAWLSAAHKEHSKAWPLHPIRSHNGWREAV